MENIVISKVCGLCAGCNFAILTATKNLQNHKKVTLFKEIVHNDNVNKMLKEKGVSIKDDLNQIKKDELIILRAHGEPPKTYDYLKKNGIDFVDCTCINVKKIHEEIEKFSKDGYMVIIIGKYGKTSGIMHPEIAGSVGYSTTKPILVEDEDDLNKLNINLNKVYVTCQTTFNEAKADKILEKIKAFCEENNILCVINKSICSAQKQINIYSAKLAKTSDLMFVVGGKKSSNTIELFNNVSSYAPTIFLEDINDFKTELKKNNIKLSKDMKIGITAGASTMKSELEELKKLLKNEIGEKYDD